MTSTSSPKCPWCNTRKHVRTSGTNRHAFYCGRCGREFEDVDDGDVAYGRPDRRMIRQEEGRLKRLRRQHGKRNYPSANAGD